MRYDLLEPPTTLDGMDGLLSTLTFGLLGKKKEQVTLSHDEIMSQVAIEVSKQLMAAGRTVDVAKAKEAAGYNIQQYDAWVLMMTSPDTVAFIVSKTVTDLLNTPGLVGYMPGYAPAGGVPGAVAVPSGSAAATGGSTSGASGITLDSRSLMILGGVAVAGLVLGKRRVRRR